MKKYYKKFMATEDLYTALGGIEEVSDKIDTATMIEKLPKVPRTKLHLETVEGKTVPCQNFKQFLLILKSLTDIEVIPSISFARGTIFNVFTYKDYFDTEVETVEEEEVVVEAPVTVSEESSEEVDTIVSEFDKDFAESLYNEDDKSGSKDELEAYGKTFGVDLKKNKTFENMLIDLVTFIEE